MLKKIAVYICTLCFVVSSAVFYNSAYASDKISKNELRDALMQLLQEEPDLVMNVLKRNSETVLEIAQQGNIERKRKLLFAQWLEDSQKPKKINFSERNFRGPKSAPVTVVAYSDYTCNFCRQSEIVLDILRDKYKDKLRVTFKVLPNRNNPLSLAAAQYSTAAFMQDEEKGWKFHDILFAKIDEMAKGGDAFIKDLATELKLDLKRLQRDAASSEVDKRLEEDREEADELGITGTPHFLVNNLVIGGAVSVDVFDRAVEMALKIHNEETKGKR